MPLTILLPLVVIGILGITAILHLAGCSRRFVIADAAVARAQWARHFPGERVDAVHLAPGGLVALVEASGGAGLLRSFGADTVAHRIAGVRRAGARLWVRFGEFGHPPVWLDLPPGLAADWEARLQGGCAA